MDAVFRANCAMEGADIQGYYSVADASSRLVIKEIIKIQTDGRKWHLIVNITSLVKVRKEHYNRENEGWKYLRKKY